MQSAAIIAQQAKDAAKAEASPGGALTSITTAGAIIDEDDRIFLHDNPLRTTTEVLCPTCRLPRLQHPTMGKGAQAPDPAKEYCARQPFIDKDGCDIYGKSLALEKPSKKKSNAPAKNNKDKSGSRSGSEDGDSPPGKANDKPAATAIPSGKCPNCPRYMAFTRIAQHMDRCLGLSGRQSSKNAMNKLQANTPRDQSRASTPKPASNSQVKSEAANGSLGSGANGKKRKLEKGSDEETEENTPLKKKKLGLKKDKEGKGKAAVNSSIQRVKFGKSGKERTPDAEDSKKGD